MRSNFAKPFPNALMSAQRLPFLLLAGSASIVLVSIAASQILLAGSILGALWLCVSGKEEGSGRNPILWPLLIFFLWTVAAACASPGVWLGLKIIKKFNWFLVLFLVPLLARGAGKIRYIYHAIFAMAVLAAVMGIFQFAADPRRDLLHRISGFMSQWMTYSGLLMLVTVGLAAYIACIGWRKHWWTIPLCPIFILPLYLSETRNAWLGTVAGVLVILVLRRPRALVGVLALLLAIFLLSPEKFQQRLRTGWDPGDPNTRNRIELFGTSLRLIRDNPWFGVGPNNVKHEALRYRGSRDFPDWLYQHMHNNFLQIAAERGIPGLLLWLWFMGRLAWDALRLFHRTGIRPGSNGTDEAEKEALLAATAALGAWFALLVAGLFEYNFGDSEVLMLFLFMTSAPYAFLSRAHSGQAATDQLARN